jgi:zona occludens toxin (predicted ATPase)
MQGGGNAEKAVGIATAMGMSVTDELTVGIAVSINNEATTIEEKKVVYELTKLYNIPASGKTNNTMLLEGVGYWYIESDFVVS